MCGVHALCHLLGWPAVTSQQMLDFRAHPSTWGADVTQTADADVVFPLGPEDTAPDAEGNFTIALLACWFERFAGAYLVPAAAAEVPASMPDGDLRALLDRLAASHNTSAFFAATTTTGSACHYFAFRHFQGAWHILDSLSARPLALGGRTCLARRRGPFRLLYAHPIPYPVNRSAYHRPLARINSAPRTSGHARAPPSMPGGSRADAATTWRRGPAPDGTAQPATLPRSTRRGALASLPQGAALSAAVRRFVLAALQGAGEGVPSDADVQRITDAIMLQRAADWAPRCSALPDNLDLALLAEVRSFVEDDFVRNNRTSRRPMLARVALRGYSPGRGSDSSAAPSSDGDSARGPRRPARRQRVAGPSAAGPAS
jgi:hypothetical protein